VCCRASWGGELPRLPQTAPAPGYRCDVTPCDASLPVSSWSSCSALRPGESPTLMRLHRSSTTAAIVWAVHDRVPNGYARFMPPLVVRCRCWSSAAGRGVAFRRKDAHRLFSQLGFQPADERRCSGRDRSLRSTTESFWHAVMDLGRVCRLGRVGRLHHASLPQANEEAGAGCTRSPP
jgi:hypothetical protein